MHIVRMKVQCSVRSIRPGFYRLLDMFQYDRCWPFQQKDAAAISHAVSGTAESDTVQFEVATYTELQGKEGAVAAFTLDRWRSLNLFPIEIEGNPVS